MQKVPALILLPANFVGKKITYHYDLSLGYQKRIIPQAGKQSRIAKNAKNAPQRRIRAVAGIPVGLHRVLMCHVIPFETLTRYTMCNPIGWESESYPFPRGFKIAEVSLLA